MKKLYTSILCLLSFSLFAQDFQLFKSGTDVVFTDSVKGFSVTFDSINYENGDSVYYNFTTINDNFTEMDTCVFWGGEWGKVQDKATWLGSKIISNNNGVYQLTTLQGEALNFTFNVNIGDSTLFYKDASQNFYLKYKSEQIGTALNYTDELRYYDVIHTDTSGNTINSELHGSEIIIGKELGLVQFFQIDQFPKVLNPVYLLGHSKLDLGLHEITEADVYDYQVGDEIQYHKYYYNSSGNPELNYSYYEKFEILERLDEIDSVHYLAEQRVFTLDSNASIVGQVRLSYSKLKMVHSLPFEVYDGEKRRLVFGDYDNLDLWEYRIGTDQHLMYCELENSWGSYDAGGPLGNYENNYIIGVGLDQNNSFVGQQSGSSSGERIVYFKKNGYLWGNEVVLGVRELELEAKIKIFPNPVSSLTTIKTTKNLQNAKLRVLDVSGKVVLKMEGIYGASITLFTEQLSNGFYYLELSENKSVIAFEKLVVQH